MEIILESPSLETRGTLASSPELLLPLPAEPNMDFFGRGGSGGGGRESSTIRYFRCVVPRKCCGGLTWTGHGFGNRR